MTDIQRVTWTSFASLAIFSFYIYGQDLVVHILHSAQCSHSDPLLTINVRWGKCPCSDDCLTPEVQYSLTSGQLIVGGNMVTNNGNNYLSSVELFPSPSSDACSIPDLPQTRIGHSLSLLSGGRLVVCGGNNEDRNTCIYWVEGKTDWALFGTMRFNPKIPSKMEAVVSGNDFWGFRNGNRNRKFHS